jgi:hypothetical protein
MAVALRRRDEVATPRGQATLAIVVLLSILAFGYFLSQGALILASAKQKYIGVEDQQTRIKRALLQFVQLNYRLPCPADGGRALTDAGAGYPDANPAYPAVASCTYPGGVVPWKVLGLSLNDVTDPWGRFISYRVYDGFIGFTQPGGMSKVNCDTTNTVSNATEIDVGGGKRTGVTYTTPETARSSSGLCNPDTNTLSASFDTGKGLTVSDFTNTYTDVAFVLISHGPTGLGGYVPSSAAGGERLALPQTAAADYNNTQPQQGAVLTTGAYTGFIKMAASLSSVTAGSAGHYDNVVDYMRIDDVARLAGVDARDWPESVASVAPVPAFSAATVGDMTSTTSTTSFHVSMATGTSQQFQATTDSSGTVDGALAFGSGTGAYSSCTWSPTPVNLYKAPTATLAGANSTAGTITFTTTANHNLSVGDTVTVSGTNPSSYDGTYTVQAATAVSFTVFTSVSPTAWVAGGSVKKVSMLKAGTSWNSATGVTTYVTASAHGLAVGDSVQISGARSMANGQGSTVDYNGTFTVVSVPSATSFTVADSVEHGTWISGGIVTRGFKQALMISAQVAFNSANAGGGLVLGFLPGTTTIFPIFTLGASSILDLSGLGLGVGLGSSFTYPASSGTPTFHVGNVVTVSGMAPSGFNGLYTVLQINAPVTTTLFGTTFTLVPGSIVASPVSGFPLGLGLGSSGSGGVITSSVCGSAAASAGGIGWENGADGSLPTPRFGVELDLFSNTPYLTTLDPSFDHAAVDFDGVVHDGTAASACAPPVDPSPNTYHTVANPFIPLTNGTGWSGAITFVTSVPHGLSVGSEVTVAGASPSGFNGTYTVTATPTATSFTVSSANNPGTWGSGGTVNGSTSIVLESGTSWTGTATFVTAINHSVVVGDRVDIANTVSAGPGTYNGTQLVLTTPSSNTFTSAMAVNPGTWTSGGSYAAHDCYIGLATSPGWLKSGLGNFHSVRIEVEPQSQTCGGTAPLVKFWLLPFTVCHPPIALASGTAWSNGVVKFKTSASHAFAVGNSVTVSGASPTGYNGTYTVTGVPDSTTFTVSLVTNPGAWVSGGTPLLADTATECAGMASMTAQFHPQTFSSSGVHLWRCTATPSPSSAFDSLFFGFTSNNTSSNNTQNNVILQDLLSGVISVP